MSISGIGANAAAYAAGLFAGGASGAQASASDASGASSALSASSASQPPAGDSNNALQYLTNYLKESPAKRIEDAWLAQHHLTEQELAAMPPAEQSAIRQQIEDDIKKKLQAQSGGAGAGAYANVVA